MRASLCQRHDTATVCRFVREIWTSGKSNRFTSATMDIRLLANYRTQLLPSFIHSISSSNCILTCNISPIPTASSDLRDSVPYHRFIFRICQIVLLKKLFPQQLIKMNTASPLFISAFGKYITSQYCPSSCSPSFCASLPPTWSSFPLAFHQHMGRFQASTRLKWVNAINKLPQC